MGDEYEDEAEGFICDDCGEATPGDDVQEGPGSWGWICPHCNAFNE